jgi:Zn-dependent membrane protease YugP
VSFSSQIINFIFIASFLLAGVFSIISIESALIVVIACQAFITLFAVVTLPVEFDATNRGLMWLNGAGLTHGEEHTKAQKALNLAAMTYVIAALSALATLLYYILIFLSKRD